MGIPDYYFELRRSNKLPEVIVHALDFPGLEKIALTARQYTESETSFVHSVEKWDNIIKKVLSEN